jgi:hypothetical protein
MTWGSLSWHLTSEMVAVWPERTWTGAFVRISHTYMGDRGQTAVREQEVGETYASDGIPTGGDEDVQCRMEAEGINARQVAVIVPDDLVHLEVPTFHHLVSQFLELDGVNMCEKRGLKAHLVFATREEIRMPWADGESTDCRDMAGERELQLSRSEIPNLPPVEISDYPMSNGPGRRTLMTLSPAPVANHWFPGSTATLRTQPRWPEITRRSFHWGW